MEGVGGGGTLESDPVPSRGAEHTVVTARRWGSKRGTDGRGRREGDGDGID